MKEVHLDVIGLLVAGEMISELERILEEQKIDKISSFYPEESKRSTKTSMRTFLGKFQTVLQLLNLSNLQHSTAACLPCLKGINLTGRDYLVKAGIGTEVLWKRL